MEWRDTGILLALATYGEKGFLAHVLTPERGRVRGMVYRNRGKPTPGTRVSAIWKARDESQLGTLTLEPLPSPHVFQLFSLPDRLKTFQETLALLVRVLPEHHAYPGLFPRFDHFLTHLPTTQGLKAKIVFEVDLLRLLGYGLDFSQCAVTGDTADLAFISPKTGRAVSRRGAGTYAPRLLPLPPFLLDPSADLPIPPEDLAAGLALTSFFMRQHWG